MKDFLKKIDAFDKIENQDLVLSEDNMFYVSQAMSFISTFLIFAQIILMVTPQIHRDLSTDQIHATRTDLVNASLNVIINMPCELLHIDVLDSIGHKQYYVNDTIKWRKLNEAESVIGIYNKQKVCHPCYELYDSSICCNGCEKLKELYKQANKTANPDEWPQCKPENKQQFSKHEKCQVKGKVSINRVPGSFHIAIGQSYDNYGHSHLLLDDYPSLEFSHVINDLRFGANLPMISNPLRGTQVNSDGIIRAYEYHLMITPVVFFADGQYIEKSFEYTVLVASNQWMTPGIYFFYSFTPYTISVTWRSRSFRAFLISTGGLLSGIYAIFSLFSSFMDKPAPKKEKVETKADTIPENEAKKIQPKIQTE